MGFALSHMQLTSNALGPGGAIPTKYTGEGADISPPLAWTSAPDGVQQFAVICHDPDAPLVKSGIYGYVHWVLYGLPGNVERLEEGTDRGVAGTNDFGKARYSGPMPPEGHGTHHYYFWLLALRRTLELDHGLTLPQLLVAIEPHLMGMNRLVGTYRRG